MNIVITSRKLTEPIFQIYRWVLKKHLNLRMSYDTIYALNKNNSPIYIYDLTQQAFKIW